MLGARQPGTASDGSNAAALSVWTSIEASLVSLL